ncbi:MFS transporter [Sulfobacillus sp. hq2]|uniref:MFS transporter n=1 Tax=Sulfobacillus TaxID=28033 RepID=UPI001A9A5FEE|nr:MFS transporter [Sulfobacillus sp. hq2]MCY0909427.1 MFS transporter [Sulfobacillus thermotolerans]
MRVPMWKMIFYSSNQLGVNLLWQAFNTVAVFYYVTVLNVPGAALSLGLIAFGIINAFFNLFAGYLSDRTTTRWGRRIPYVLVSALPFGLAFYFLFSPPRLGVTTLIYYFLTLTFLFDFFFTVTTLNIMALFPEMYQESHQRNFVSALSQVFGIVGLILGVALSKSLGQLIGWGAMALAFGLLGSSSVYLALFGSFEDPAYRAVPALAFKDAIRATFSNRQFVFYVVASFLIQLVTTMLTTIAAFYTKYVVPLSPLQYSLFMGAIFVVAIPVSFLWAKIANRFSNATATLLSTALCALTLLSFLFDHSPSAVIGTGVILGLSISGFLVLLNVLLADVIDYDAKQTGQRREGMYLGMNGFIVRIGLSVQYAIMALFFAVSGFDSRRTIQSARAIWGFRILLGGLPVVLLIAALGFLLAYRRQTLVAESA